MGTQGNAGAAPETAALCGYGRGRCCMNPALLAAMRPRVQFRPVVDPPDTAPGQPSNLRTTSVSSSAVALAWNAPGSGGEVTGYDLLRGGVVIQSGLQGLSAVDSSVTPGTGYSYTVRAVGPGGTGPESGALVVEVPSEGGAEPFFEDDFESYTVGQRRPDGGNADFNW